MNIKGKYIGVLLTLIIASLLGVVYKFISRYDFEKVQQYHLRHPVHESQLKTFLTYPMDSISLEEIINFIDDAMCDYDIVYMPRVDTIWDKNNHKCIIDTFNIRLVTHGRKEDPDRDQNFTKWVKGCCKVGFHCIYIYDDETLEALFLPTNQSVRVKIDKSRMTNYTIEKEVVAYVNDSIFRFVEVDDKKHKYNTGVDYFLTLKNFEDKTGLYLYNDIKNTKK